MSVAPGTAPEATAEATSEPILRAEALCKRFVTGERTIVILDELELAVSPGETIAILGQSGIGKSTLLHILGTLDHPNEGHVWFQGEDVFAKDDDELARFRNRSLGFVFQFHHLLPEFTALENVMMPCLLRELPRAEARERAMAILHDVALDERVNHLVGKLSGGERQRVALARALVLDPPLLLADEPTGNLDPETGARVGDLLLELNEERGTALVVVTHNHELAGRLGRTVTLAQGRLR